MLKRSDRTVGIGKGGCEMGEDLGRRRPSQLGRRFGRHRDQRASSEQRRADRALAPVEPLPEALQGPLAAREARGPYCGGDRAADDALQKVPQSACRHAPSSDRVGEPDTEGEAATASPIAIAAEDASGPDGLAWRAVLVVAEQNAVPNELADGVAMGTGHLLEPQGEGEPLMFISAKPSRSHMYPPPPGKIRKPPILLGLRIAG
jgi:hypothetical protein